MRNCGYKLINSFHFVSAKLINDRNAEFIRHSVWDKGNAYQTRNVKGKRRHI